MGQENSKDELSNSSEVKKTGLFKRIGNFAKNKPSIFVLILLGILFVLMFITYESLHLTSTPTFCGRCHVDAESGPGGEYHSWKKNIHSFAGVGCIDCHGKPGLLGYMRAKMGGMYDLYGEIFHSKEHKMEILTKGATDKEYAKKLAPNDWCLICHSDDANKRIRDNTVMSFMGLEMRMVDGVKNPEFRESNGLRDIFNDEMQSISFSHDNHVNTLGLSCMECHMGVAHGGEFINKPKMETCFACHDTERAKNPEGAMPENENCAACHSRVVALHDGTLLSNMGVETTPPDMMVDLGVYGAENCSSCHETAFTKPTRESCGTACHGENDYSDMFDSIREEYDKRKAPLDELNIKFYEYKNKMTKEQIAEFNSFKDLYEMIYNDKSKGIHNNALAQVTFDKAYEIGTKLAESLGIPVPVSEE